MQHFTRSFMGKVFGDVDPHWTPGSRLLFKSLKNRQSPEDLRAVKNSSL